MKSITPQKTHKNLIVSLVIILGVALCLLACLYYFKIGPFAPTINNSISTSESTKEESKVGSDIKSQSINQADSGKENTGSDPSLAPQPVPDSDKKSVGMEITAINQTESTLQVRTLIQTITNSGSCTVLMKNVEGKTYSTSADVQALSSTTTCKGFDIALGQLQPGVWTIVINFNNDRIIASTNKEVTIW